MDRSTRNLSIITLLVLVIFLALNNIAQRSALIDWSAVIFFLLLALLIWFYDRVSRRGVDDSEASDADVIEPLVYDHAAPLGIPDTIELVGPNPTTVIKSTHAHAAVMEAAPPAPASVKPDAAPRELEPDVSPTPTADVPEAAPTHSEFPAVGLREEAARAPMPSSVINANPPPVKAVEPSAFVAAAPAPVEEKTAPPAPAAAQAAPPATVPTTIEEKTAPPPSASAPPASPVAAKMVEETQPVTAVEPTLTTPGGKVTPANPNLEVSATAAADAAPIKNDPNLPMKAVTDKPDDLKIIEGIGPKMEKALKAAGITTFAMLAGTSEAQLKEAIAAAGMRFAPSVPTWAEQASYAANGDFVGLEAFQKTLVGGRKSK